MNDKEVRELVEKNKLKHIAVIMDGNRRWAKLHGLPTAFGHKKGVDALKATVRACDDFGIKYLTVYAFSTENWHRTPTEVKFLMDLFLNTLKNEIDDLHQNNVLIRFLGNRFQLSESIQDVMKEAEEKTKNNTGVNLQISFNYGSRAEIVNAVKNIAEKIQNKEMMLGDIDEELISKELYTKNIPDPDILLRTGGEKRISNYLLWQIAYSEIIVVDELWPEYNKKCLKKTIEEFNTRNRRFGE